VPDLVTFGEVSKNCVVEKAVRVGHEANAHASGMIALNQGQALRVADQGSKLSC
jgi:hypothetical protein